MAIANVLLVILLRNSFLPSENPELQDRACNHTILEPTHRSWSPRTLEGFAPSTCHKRTQSASGSCIFRARVAPWTVDRCTCLLSRLFAVLNESSKPCAVFMVTILPIRPAWQSRNMESRLCYRFVTASIKEHTRVDILRRFDRKSARCRRQWQAFTEGA